MDEQNIDPQSQEQSSIDCPQCHEYLDGWKRAQADYANLKKENERDRLELVKYSNERLLHEILPVIDQFEMGMAFMPEVSFATEDDQKKFKNWVTGLNAVRSLWGGAFQSIGLEKVRVTGEFDPQIHEAVSRERAEGVSAGHIIRVAQDGWQLHGKLLRPAKVIVNEEI